MLYKIIRKILFQLNPECAHRLALTALHYLPGKSPTTDVKTQRRVMGLNFPNFVGAAAGMDKNAEYIDALSKCGFGFIEVGTVTPKPQAGNPQPRLFRLPEQQAIINRMGFNNKGVDYLLRQLEKTRYKGILGINIGKNAVTPLEHAVDDYLLLLRKVYDYASYITVNISSPNTPGLRKLQTESYLSPLLASLKAEQQLLAEQRQRYVPLAVKIDPDLTDQQLQVISKLLLLHKIDGVIATNTTLARAGVENNSLAGQQGGLSGQPLAFKSTQIIKKLSAELQGKIPVIGVGGIMSVADAEEKIAAGASLVQLYTGFVYHGPPLIKALASIRRPRSATKSRF